MIKCKYICFGQNKINMNTPDMQLYKRVAYLMLHLFRLRQASRTSTINCFRVKIIVWK